MKGLESWFNYTLEPYVLNYVDKPRSTPENEKALRDAVCFKSSGGKI